MMDDDFIDVCECPGNECVGVCIDLASLDVDDLLDADADPWPRWSDH